MDVSAFQRVLVAGFISGGTEDVDANLETVRLLRSQLRTKSSLRVIEADPLPLVGDCRGSAEGRTAAAPPDHVTLEPVAQVGSSGAPPDARRRASRPQPMRRSRSDQIASRADPKATDPKIRNEKDFQRYDKIFADTAYWKKLGEEYQNPLIVTGTVLFTPHQASGFVTHEREVYDSFGRRSVVPVRTYMERKGFILRPKFVFIDGRTGAILYSENFREEILYNAQQNTPALSSYFELMDRLIPSFLSTLSSAEDPRHPRPAQVSCSDPQAGPKGLMCRALPPEPWLCYSIVLPLALQGALEVFAIIQSGGRQVKVTPGTVIEVDRFDAEPGDEVSIDRVLLPREGWRRGARGRAVCRQRRGHRRRRRRDARPEDSRVQEEAPQGHAPHQGPPQRRYTRARDGHRSIVAF